MQLRTSIIHSLSELTGYNYYSYYHNVFISVILIHKHYFPCMELSTMNIGLKLSKETAMHVSCRILMLDIKQYLNINSCINNIIAELQAMFELGTINFVIKILFYIYYNNY